MPSSRAAEPPSRLWSSDVRTTERRIVAFDLGSLESDEVPAPGARRVDRIYLLDRGYADASLEMLASEGQLARVHISPAPGTPMPPGIEMFGGVMTIHPRLGR